MLKIGLFILIMSAPAVALWHTAIRPRSAVSTQNSPPDYDNVTWTEFSIYLMCCVNEIDIKSYFHVIVTSVLWEEEISLKRSIFRFDGMA